VHLFFWPLDLIVNTCGGPDIVSSVPAPCSPEMLWAFCAATWYPKRCYCESHSERPGLGPIFRPQDLQVPLSVPKFHSG
jgi:epidermal growth factor receptor kinase substrate 8